MEELHKIANRYDTVRTLGEGGMATVLLAKDRELDKLVAIKILNSECAANPEMVARLKREARILSRLRHKGVPAYDGFGYWHDGRPYIVMGYVEGPTLHQRQAELWAKKEKMLPAEVAKIGIQLCDVLIEVHACGIVHRDLKPLNILLTNDGVCILDFGIAKELPTSPDETQVHTPADDGNIYMGTQRYMSPEQHQCHSVDVRTDLYSLGVILVEMLSGPLAADVKSPKLQVDPKEPTTLPLSSAAKRKLISRRLALAVNALAADNPAERPASAEAARLLLRNALDPRQYPLPAKPKPSRARTKWLVTAAAAILVLALIGVRWLPRAHQSTQIALNTKPADTVTQPKLGPAARPSPDATPESTATPAQKEIVKVMPSPPPTPTPVIRQHGRSDRPKPPPPPDKRPHRFSQQDAASVAKLKYGEKNVRAVQFSAIKRVPALAVVRDNKSKLLVSKLEWTDKRKSRWDVPYEQGFFHEIASFAPPGGFSLAHGANTIVPVDNPLPGFLFVEQKDAGKARQRDLHRNEPFVRLAYVDPYSQTTCELAALPPLNFKKGRDTLITDVRFSGKLNSDDRKRISNSLHEVANKLWQARKKNPGNLLSVVNALADKYNTTHKLATPRNEVFGEAPNFGRSTGAGGRP